MQPPPETDMTATRKTLTIAIALLIAAPIALTQSPAAAKLYHWVSADGKDHYSDVLPPEALSQARQELSSSNGATIKQVERAQTPEEQAAAAAKAAADAQAAEAAQKAKENDQALLTSYPTEGDLQRVNDQKIAQQSETLKSIRVGMESQQQSLSSLLVDASNHELSGTPISPKLADSIQATRKQVLNQQAMLIVQEARSENLRQEAAATMARYRALRTAADAERAAAASGAQTAPPPPPPPHG
jgi:hypothetical protein